MLIQACLNGMRAEGSHPALPVTPAAIAAEGVAAVAAGAAELHLHVRGPDGLESLAPEAVAATLAAVRVALPGTIVGISTGAWIEKDDDRTLALIDRWDASPDHASVNLGEAAAPAVIERLHRRGVGIEAGLADEADVARLLILGLDRLALRVLIEIGLQDPDEAAGLASRMLEALARGGCTKPVLLHGLDRSAWPLVRFAFERRLSTRIGLEDVLRLADGSPAGGNAELVAAALAMMRGEQVAARA